MADHMSELGLWEEGVTGGEAICSLVCASKQEAGITVLFATHWFLQCFCSANVSLKNKDGIKRSHTKVSQSELLPENYVHLTLPSQ